jgi:hypothetical protein
MDVVLRIDMLKEMDARNPFDISWITYDAKRGTGGKLMHGAGFVKQGLDTENEIVLISDPKDYRQHPIPVHWQLITRFNNKIAVN